MSEKEKGTPNLFDAASPEEKATMFKYAEDYMEFLRTCSADRERVQWVVKRLEAAGFRQFALGQEGALPAGSKFYYLNKGKNILCGITGQQTDKFTVVGTHLDVPHIDLRPNFVNEQGDQGLCTLKTHHYGGLKKYLFATTPLMMKVFFCKDGQMRSYSIGDQPSDPVLTIPDLLIHLSSSQSERKMRDVMKAEEMKAVACTSKGSCAKFSERFLQLLAERTQLTEKDLPFCEFQLFPAHPPRFVGLDKAAIGAAGQDDGICSFAAVQALLNIAGTPSFTAVAVLHSYEETGSQGNFGAQSQFLVLCLKDLMYRLGLSEAKQQAALYNSLCVAADVTCLYDANFASIHDKMNAAVINRGCGLERYTGSAGKSGSSEVSAELLSLLRKTLRENTYQFAMLGEVDVGGGGTTAKFLSQQLCCDVVDIGPGVMNMHSPFELTGVADLWAAVDIYQRLMARQE